MLYSPWESVPCSRLKCMCIPKFCVPVPVPGGNCIAVSGPCAYLDPSEMFQCGDLACTVAKVPNHCLVILSARNQIVTVWREGKCPDDLVPVRKPSLNYLPVAGIP